MRLYEITDALRTVFDMDIPEEQKADTLNELKLDFAVKIDGCLAYRQEMIAQADSFKAEIERLTALKKSAESKANSMTNYVKSNMLATNITKHTGLFMATIGKPSQRVEVTDESKLSYQYFKTTVCVDKSKLSQDLKNGINIEGASLVDGEPRFTIK